jgi:hypothetical protein
MQTSVRIEGFDLENASQVQSEKNDDDARYPGQRVFVNPEHLADHGRCRAQRDKNDAEPQNEPNGVHHHPPHELSLRRLEFFQAGAGDQRKVSRHQRQHAGRQKGNQPGEKRGNRQSGRLDMRLYCTRRSSSP